MPSTELTGFHVLVTRPKAQAQPLATALQACGASAHLFPLIDIQPDIDAKAKQKLAQLADIDVLIFISANAIEYAAPYLGDVPKSCKIAVIGQASNAKLAELGYNADLVPHRFDSEGLLVMPDLQQLSGQRILIVRGHGGREKLAKTLQARGAHVDYAQVYRRQAPREAWPDTLRRVHVISITSSEALVHLHHFAQQPQQDWILAKQLLVIHERVAVRATELGFKLKSLIADEPSDAGMVRTLCQWAANREPTIS